jgi:hypothetical protein
VQRARSDPVFFFSLNLIGPQKLGRLALELCSLTSRGSARERRALEAGGAAEALEGGRAWSRLPPDDLRPGATAGRLQFFFLTFSDRIYVLQMYVKK